MKAIEQGIITESTKARLQDLETKKHSLEEKILLAEYSEQQKITKQEIPYFFVQRITFLKFWL